MSAKSPVPPLLPELFVHYLGGSPNSPSMASDSLLRMLSHIVVQNAHNAARLNALLQATAYLLAKQDGTDYDEEIKRLYEQVNAAIPGLLGEALDAINDVPDIA